MDQTLNIVRGRDTITKTPSRMNAEAITRGELLELGRRIHRASEAICIHHTHAERESIKCAVCLESENKRLTAERDALLERSMYAGWPANPNGVNNG